MQEWGPFKSAVQLKKPFKGVRKRWGNWLPEWLRKMLSPIKLIWFVWFVIDLFPLQANQWLFTIKQRENIELEDRPAATAAAPGWRSTRAYGSTARVVDHPLRHTTVKEVHQTWNFGKKTNVGAEKCLLLPRCPVYIYLLTYMRFLGLSFVAQGLPMAWLRLNKRLFAKTIWLLRFYVCWFQFDSWPISM